MATRDSNVERLQRAVAAVLPNGALRRVRILGEDTVRAELTSGSVTALWIGEGWRQDARKALALTPSKPDLLVARRMSKGAQAYAVAQGLGWLDESGAAELVMPGLVIARTGHQSKTFSKPPRWSPSVVGAAEALLVGTTPTVAAVQEHTGLSAGSATTALHTLTSLGLLDSDAARGRHSARRIVDFDHLLNQYATAAIARKPKYSVQVGSAARDLIAELAVIGSDWDNRGVRWAATGSVAAAVLGPYLSEVTTLDIFVDAPTVAALHAIADRSGLRPISGGRILLRPFPTAVTQHLSNIRSGVRLAPWPRVYADLQILGVRGEEAAEHLLEVMRIARG